LGLLVGGGGALGLAADHAAKAELAHQAFHGAAGHGDALAPQLPPDLASAVHAVVGLPDTLDLGLELLVSPLSGRGLQVAGLVGVVGAGRQLEDPADRLDPEAIPQRVDHLGHLVRGRSSSAAK
jgi:hypothetical protein